VDVVEDVFDEGKNGTIPIIMAIVANGTNDII